MRNHRTDERRRGDQADLKTSRRLAARCWWHPRHRCTQSLIDSSIPFSAMCAAKSGCWQAPALGRWLARYRIMWCSMPSCGEKRRSYLIGGGERRASRLFVLPEAAALLDRHEEMLWRAEPLQTCVKGGHLDDAESPGLSYRDEVLYRMSQTKAPGTSTLSAASDHRPRYELRGSSRKPGLSAWRRRIRWKWGTGRCTILWIPGEKCCFLTFARIRLSACPLIASRITRRCT